MTKKKILVADDEPHIVKIIKSRLQANNYKVVTASDGEEAFKKALREIPDLIIIDLIMPKMDGYSFVKKIKKHPEMKNIAIIVLSAKDKLSGLLKSEGVNDYIVKPCTAEDLLSKVEEHIK